jgi:hypothetical protein
MEQIENKPAKGLSEQLKERISFQRIAPAGLMLTIFLVIISAFSILFHFESLSFICNYAGG